MDLHPRGRALPWNRSVTFSVTHDVPNNDDGFHSMLLDPVDEYLANAYLLGRDGGVPLMYSDHGESVARYPADQGRWEGLFQRPALRGMLAFHNAMQGAPQRCLVETDGFLVFARGDRGLCTINKTGEWQSPLVPQHGLRPGRYTCCLHGHSMSIAPDAFSLQLPPREAQLWLREE